MIKTDSVRNYIRPGLAAVLLREVDCLVLILKDQPAWLGQECLDHGYQPNTTGRGQTSRREAWSPFWKY